MCSNLKRKNQQSPSPSGLPSHFAALRFVCGCFGVEMPEMDRMLQIMRKRETNPDKFFPKKLNRVMLNDAERGTGLWCEALATVAHEALYDRILRQSGQPLFGFTGHLTERLSFAVLRLYEKISPKLNTDGVSPTDTLWVLFEEVFVPTIFLELALNWQRGLGTEFQIENCWYLPLVEENARLNPVSRVLRCWFRAAGFRYSHDLGKALDDSVRRKVDRWLSGECAPKLREAHDLVDKFADDVRWLDSPDDWKTRFTLACASEKLCEAVDACFRATHADSSLKIVEMLQEIHTEGVAVDDGWVLADSHTFFAARLLQRRLQNGEKWDAEIMARVRNTQARKCPTNPSEDEMEQFRHEIEWGMKPGNWFLEFIKREVTTAKRGTSLQERILDVGIHELNRILNTKRGLRVSARRP